MKTKLLLLVLVLIMGYSACKKGDTGAIGPAGKEGAPGASGSPGVKGADGSMFYSGTTVPATTIGKAGDLYFQTSTSLLFGPKTSTGWGTGVSIRGANGTNGSNGKAGSQFLSGTSIPATTVGVVGDFYFNTAQMVLYGPKTASGWGVGTNLKAEARVMYSGWTSATGFRDSVIDGANVPIAHIYAPYITAEAANQSMIMVYLDYGGGTFPLPYTMRGAVTVNTISYKLKLRELIIYRLTHQGATNIPLSGIIKYRYMIIPSNIYLGLKQRNIDLDNPEAVQEALKLFR